MILDTSFVIDLLRGEEDIEDWIDKFDSNEEIPILNPITAMELWEGAHLSNQTEEELEKIRDLLEGLTPEDFNIEDGKLSGEINADLTKKGKMIDLEDAMIAAIALNAKQPILTRNPEHFERVDGTEVETY